MEQLIWDKIKKIIKNLPNLAGIYQFFNDSWKVIYIWKSVNLKSRVNSYFNWKSKLNFAKKQMVNDIKDIKYIVVENETESLILETNLIKENLPKYNILMKDWKNHVYIKITNEEFPKIIKTRIKNKYWEYFWPYVSAWDIDNILKILKKVFGYWIWKNNFFSTKANYNLDEYLFEWKINSKNDKEIKELYEQKIEEIKRFLKWDQKEVLKNLREQMMSFAMNHEFERAEIIKNQLLAIETLSEKQIVREWIIWDFDIINYLEKFDKIFIWKIEIRNSKIIWFYPCEVENNLWENVEIILENYIKNNYLTKILEDSESKKPIIICSKQIKLKEKIFEKIKIEFPKIGTKIDLLKMCYKNIYEFAYKKHIASLSTKSFTKWTMKNILFKLDFERINKNIIFECNDISHLSWTYTVASRSIIENWKTNPNKYRKFKIKTLKETEINDFDSMREIITRRLAEVEKLWNIPDLIVIDWWKWQLSSVTEIVNKSKWKDKLQLVWIAKKEEILYTLKDWNFKEFVLESNSLELRLIQKIRDEAHRFAITFNRDSRIKASKKNILESIPGIWPKTRKKILKEFGNIENLAEQKKEYLRRVLGTNVLNILEEHGII